MHRCDYVIIRLVLLSNLLIRCVVDANIRLVNLHNDTIAEFVETRPSYSPKYPPDGLWAHHIFVTPSDGCSALSNPPSNETKWIAVMLYSRKCAYVDRAVNAEKSGYSAVIVCINQSSDYFDVPGKVSGKVTIPLVYVSGTYIPILRQYQNHSDVYTVLISLDSKYELFSWLMIGLSVLIVLLLTLVLIFAFVRCSRCVKGRVGLLSRWKLKKLAVHTYRKGDSYEVCAICLEEYQIGDELRILPCSHAYHCKCVDVWLTQNKKTCPLCNINADSKRATRLSTARTDDEDEDERTPLLSSVENRTTENRDDDDDVATVSQNTKLSKSTNDNDKSSAGNATSQSTVEIHDIPAQHKKKKTGDYGSNRAVVHGRRPRELSALEGEAKVVSNGGRTAEVESVEDNFGFFADDENVNDDVTVASPATFFIGTPLDQPQACFHGRDDRKRTTTTGGTEEDPEVTISGVKTSNTGPSQA